MADLDTSYPYTMYPYRIIFSHIGEGYDGEYDENDVNDKRLYRMDVYMKVGDDYIEIEGTSLCTNITLDIPTEILGEYADTLLRKICESEFSGETIGTIVEISSWLSNDDIVDSLPRNSERFLGQLGEGG